VQQALARDRTTIVIAYRLVSARKADRIVVIDTKQVVASRTDESLIREAGSMCGWRVCSSVWRCDHVPDRCAVTDLFNSCQQGWGRGAFAAAFEDREYEDPPRATKVSEDANHGHVSLTESN
jgi:hypothetical protein